MEDSLSIPYKTKHTPTIQSSNHAGGTDPEKLKTWVYTNVYSNLVHSYQHLEATKMSFSRRMDKLSYIQTVEYYSALKREKASKGWEKNLK